MKVCNSCGASNTDATKFCLECGVALTKIETRDRQNRDLLESNTSRIPSTIRTPPTVAPTIPPTIQETSDRLQQIQAKRHADIMFVLDCTESMDGEIEAIKDAIIDFTESIESEGVRARVGLVEFRDRFCQEQQRVLTFNGEVFTRDTEAFRREVAKLEAYGGGDWPESSLDAIVLALGQPFTPTASKIIVLVTDAPPHIPDKETKSIAEVIAAIRQRQIDRIYLVMRTRDPQSQVYLQLLEAARGLAFELGEGDDFRKRAEDFKRTLIALGKTISQATT